MKGFELVMVCNARVLYRDCGNPLFVREIQIYKQRMSETEMSACLAYLYMHVYKTKNGITHE